MDYVNIPGHLGTDLTVPFWEKLNSHTLHIMNGPSTHCQFKAANSRVQLHVKTTLVGMARSLNSDARKQPNPPPGIGLGLTANLPRDKTALQRVLYTELDQRSFATDF